jgi:dTDP-4-dehydrorhamnose reductase
VGKNNIIVLGNGFLGKKFARNGYVVWGRSVLDIRRGFTDLRGLDRYSVVVNCIAKSNTRWCEERENFKDALWSNGDVPAILSDYCKVRGKRFVHVSTGCLYDDGPCGWGECDPTVAKVNYTVTKWVGEQGCNQSDLILRPRLLFGDFVDRNNLLCKLPTFQRYVTELNSYTSVDVVVEAMECLLGEGQQGVFNVACEGNAAVKDVASWIGWEGTGITGSELVQTEHLHLINNTMSISKLKKFYQPPSLKAEVLRCWEKMR